MSQDAESWIQTVFHFLNHFFTSLSHAVPLCIDAVDAHRISESRNSSAKASPPSIDTLHSSTPLAAEHRRATLRRYPARQALLGHSPCHHSSALHRRCDLRCHRLRLQAVFNSSGIGLPCERRHSWHHSKPGY